jgi:hypothetical protein
MTLKIMDYHYDDIIGITHFPINDYYIDLNLINKYNYDYNFKCQVFEFSKGNKYKIYEEKFVEYNIKEFKDFIDFESIIDNKKDIHEELLKVALQSSRTI